MEMSTIDFVPGPFYGDDQAGHFDVSRHRATMEFDWLNCPFDLSKVSPAEVEEAFEDPFALRVLPEMESEKTRYFLLGKTISGRALFAIFWTTGKQNRVIQCRDMTKRELALYERKAASFA